MHHRTRASFLLATAAIGCANYSQLQGSETMGRGKTGVGIGVSFTKYEVDLEDDDEPESVSVPAVVVSARRGITDELEVQATAWLPLGARAGVKYRLFGETGETGLHASVGAHVGYLSLSSSSGDEESTARFVDGYLPLYLGYRASPSFEVYAVPQYMLRSVSGTGEGGVGHVTGATFGVALGERSKLYIEGGSFYDTLYETVIVNTAIGVGF